MKGMYTGYHGVNRGKHLGWVGIERGHREEVKLKSCRKELFPEGTEQA